MLTIIHGDDLTSSRNYFSQIKEKLKNAVFYEGGKITITDLVQDIEGSGLFGDSKTILIENFLTKIKKNDKSAKEMLNFLAKNSKKATFVLWEPAMLSKRDLGIFKDAIVKVFKLPKSIFLFLDNLRPNNSRNLLNLFHQVLESGTKEELVLFMMQRQVRMLLAICEPSDTEPIQELMRLTPWLKDKLERQAGLFNCRYLKKIYKRLYDIELGQKTGSLPLSLIQTIDFLLLEM